MRAVALVAFVVVVAFGATATAATPPENTTATPDDTPEIVAVYPNPVTDGDAGEFVTLAVPPETRLDRYVFGDDERMVRLPNVTASGRITLSTAPNRTERLVDSPVYRLDGVELANGGEPLRIRHNETIVERLSYDDAPDGSVLNSDGWRPIGATDRPVVTARAGTVEAFVLPDAPDLAVETLRDADRRILLGAYTLTSRDVVDALVAATERNVTVRVLVEGQPAGGLPRREARLLDELASAGADVRAVDSASARYEFHHEKYAIVDDRALVTTENWKPAGVGGASSRGWGVVTDQQPVVSGLAETFRADARWRAATPWDEFRTGKSFTETNATTGSYRSRFEPTTLPVKRTRLLVAPDNAEPAVIGILDNATESVDIQQVAIGSRQNPLLQASLDAARRGVRVRILLSSAWYTREQNRRLVAWLDERAERENLPLDARLAEPRGRFEKIHTKGVVVDSDQVLLGSLNWNNHSARQNREVVLVLSGEEVGAYYTRVFESDWPTTPPLPVGITVTVVVAGGTATAVARRLRFEAAKTEV